MSQQDRPAGEHGREGARKGPRCPLCGQPTSPKYRPFCSRRCADVDLGRWLKGAYAVPGPEAGPEAGLKAGEGTGEGAGNGEPGGTRRGQSF